MRKLCLTLAAGLAVLSTGALPSRADGLPTGGMIDRGVFEEANRPALQLVHYRGHHRRYVCTHFWNGRWHRREICFWVPGRRHHHRHHHY